MLKRNAAYTEFHSTETILTRVHSDILRNMDNQRVPLLVLLDLSAAFDTLDMNTLQQIHQHKFKISGQVSQWFQSGRAEGAGGETASAAHCSYV